MSNSAVIKKNLSSLQVLKTLALLLQGNYTMVDLVNELNKKETEPVFNNSVVSKYINTCRYCGIEICKLQNKYSVMDMPFKLKLSDREICLIEQLQTMAKSFLAKKTNDIFNQFILRVNKFLNKKIICTEKKTIKTIHEIFIRAVNNRSKISLLYDDNYIICNPIQIIDNSKITLFHVISSGEEKWLSEDKITGIEILEQKYIPEVNEQKVVFKLKGALSKKYDLREHECITGYNDNEIVVSNTGEAKDSLFARLMRYDICCEVLYPANYRNDFKKLIDDMLKIYGEL